MTHTFWNGPPGQPDGATDGATEMERAIVSWVYCNFSGVCVFNEDFTLNECGISADFGIRVENLVS